MVSRNSTTPMPEPSLATLFFAHSCKGIDKWEQYLGVYEHELSSFRAIGLPVRLLEIGVQNGGSLELWESYLPAGSDVLGLDIDSRAASLEYDNGRVRVEVADATDPKQLLHAIGDAIFDIIIDDGSHQCSDVRATFEILFDRLAQGGLYVVEDLHCSYYPSFGGGFQHDQSSIEYLKGLVDAVNYDHIARGTIADDEVKRMAHRNRQIARVAFYDSIAVIEKLRSDKERPYRRLLTGSETSLQPFQNWIATHPPSLLHMCLFGTEAAKQFEISFLEQIQKERQRYEIHRGEIDVRSTRSASALAKKRITIEKKMLKASDREVGLGHQTKSQLETIIAEQAGLIQDLLKTVRSAEATLRSMAKI